jgi:hypothetical protein
MSAGFSDDHHFFEISGFAVAFIAMTDTSVV